MKKIYTFIQTAFFLLLMFGAMINAKAQDITPPQIFYTSGDTNCIQLASVFVLKNLGVSDNVTDSADIVVELTWSNGALNSTIRGIYRLGVKATDANGNSSYKNIDFRVDDCIPPSISLNTADTVCHQWGNAYQPVQPTVSDNYYPNAQVSLVLKSSNVNPNIKGLYTEVYEATDASGNTTVKTRYVKVDDCLSSSVRNISDSWFNIYPNPATDKVTVTTGNIREQYKVSLYSCDGRLLMQTHFSGSGDIDISGLNNGLYTLVIAAADYHVSKKLTVLH